jgi:hypothetical protein
MAGGELVGIVFGMAGAGEGMRRAGVGWALGAGTSVSADAEGAWARVPAQATSAVARTAIARGRVRAFISQPAFPAQLHSSVML